SVMPCTTTRVDLSTSTDITRNALLRGQLDDLARRVLGAHPRGYARLLEQRAPLLLASPGHAHHDRLGDAQLVARLDDAAGHLVAPGDAAEDVDEDAAHVGVLEDHVHGVAHLLGVGAAADVEEVVGVAAHLLDQVEGVHG